MTHAPLTMEHPGEGNPGVEVGRAGHGVLAVLVGPVAPRTWLAASGLVVSLITGFIAFVAVVILIAVGMALLPLALVGVIILVAMLHVTRYLAMWDRARIRTFFGIEIAAPALPQRGPGQSFFSWQRDWVTSRATWKPCGYQLLRGPIMVAVTAITVATWSVAAALIALPVYLRPTVPGGSNWWFGRGTPPAGAVAGLCAAGVVLLFVAPWVTRALATVDVALARAMLGPSRKDRLSTEVTRLSVSRARVVDATDAERRRIERDLHDGVQPRLVSLAITLGRAQAKFEADPDEANRLLSQAHESAKEALSDLRGLARGIHPSVLDDRGLDAALSALVAGSPVPVSVEVDLPRRPSRTSEAVAYFFVAEAVTNVAKHAAATHASVIIGLDDAVMRILVADDGHGGAVATPGGGLAGLVDRLAAVDGTLSVASPAGGPTRLEAVIPCGW
ncbi:MAG TPA: sensor domain-containing protein [Acidimicrobiales bacterium]|jgi:signal transduction histidine kinase|nr:sensor domain-containing protein [Acidimicrobiales bacterium]